MVCLGSLDLGFIGLPVHTHSQTDRQTQTDTCTLTYRQTDRQTDTYRDEMTHRQTDRQTDRQVRNKQFIRETVASVLTYMIQWLID